MSTETFTLEAFRKQGNRLEASIQFEGRSHAVFFESDEIDLAPSREALVALTLYAGMKHGADLEVNGGLSPKTLAAIQHIQDFYRCWKPALQNISLRNVTSQPSVTPKPGRVALFFSGGLDCWYSLLKSKDEITDLVYVWGLDIPLDNAALHEQALASVRRVAEAFGKNLVVIRTNLRVFTDSYIPFNWMYGTQLASLAHVLSSEIGKVYIAGGEWYTTLIPSGSHVLVDERWSSESLEIIYDGLELSRLGKAQVVGQNELAMQTLRVCWHNPRGEYNCGRCEKCLRTMVNLQIAGALERCTTFAVPLNLKRLSRVTFFDQGDLIYLEENTRAAQAQPQNRKLHRVLRRVLNRFYFYDSLFKILGNYPGTEPFSRSLKKFLRRVYS